MPASLAIIAGVELIQSISGALQIFDATDTRIPAANIAPYNVVGVPRPSNTRLIVSLLADLAVAAQRTTKFKLVLPPAFGSPAEAEIARWQPFCSVNPANAATAAQMVSSAIFAFVSSYDPASRIVTGAVTGTAGDVVSLSLSFDFKHSMI